MAITFGNQSYGFIANESSLTLSHNNNGTFLVVAFSNNQSDTDKVTGVTYNGVAMTRARYDLNTNTGNLSTYIYYLANPASGIYNVVISLNQNCYIGCQAISMNGVDLVSPIGGVNGANSGGGQGDSSINVTTVGTSGIVMDVVMSASATPVQGGSQTWLWGEVHIDGTNDDVAGSYRTYTGAGSVNMAWTIGRGWATSAVEIKEIFIGPFPVHYNL
jgi:hypothetical protein